MIFFIIIGAVCLTDLLIKKYVETHFDDIEDRPILKGRILVRKFHNDGMFLGWLSGRQRIIGLATLTMIISLMVLLIRSLKSVGGLLFKTGLALLIGGALSNWIDRKKQGYVTDYFSFNVKWKKLRQIVFNIGDICIFIGLLLSRKKTR